MRLITSIFLIASTVATPLRAADKPQVPLTLSAPWNLSWDADTCDLIGTFGTGKNQANLKFTTFDLGNSFELSVFGQRFSSNEPKSKAKVDFGLTGTAVEKDALYGVVSRVPVVMLGTQSLVRSDPKPYKLPLVPVTSAQEAKVQDVSIKIDFRQPTVFHLGSMAPPMRALRGCMDDLVKAWGFDPAQQRSLKLWPGPSNDMATWARPSDYPAGMVLNKTTGLVRFRLNVDASGKVDGCRVVSLTNSPQFAAITCGLLTSRAKLTAAIGADGKPIRSFYISRIRWLLVQDDFYLNP